MEAALAYLKITPTMVLGKQVAKVEDLRVLDQLLALYLEGNRKPQNLRKRLKVKMIGITYF